MFSYSLHGAGDSVFIVASLWAHIVTLSLFDLFKIYKSTKCNDMRQTGYCPRGPFCAFAHVESKLKFV